MHEMLCLEEFPNYDGSLDMAFNSQVKANLSSQVIYCS